MYRKNVKIFTTGGTIDKTYDEFHGAVVNRETLIRKKLIDNLRLPHHEVEIQEIMSKDSLEMTTDDRAKIFNRIEREMPSPVPIIVLHGTDTMEHTARYCVSQREQLSMPVVFTGAMKPAEISGSDALQNMTAALMACQFLRPGFYICFHNRVFPSRTVTKDKASGTFKSLNQ